MLRDGTSGVVCQDIHEDSASSTVHFGVTRPGAITIDWRLAEVFRVDQPGEQEMGNDALAVPLGSATVVVAETQSCGGKDCLNPGAWQLHVAPRGIRHWLRARSEDWGACPSALHTLFVDPGGVRVLMSEPPGSLPPFWYHLFTIDRQGGLSWQKLDAARAVPDDIRGAICVASRRDGSLTVSVPISSLDRTDYQPRMLKLSFPHAWSPLGPDIFPGDQHACPPPVDEWPLEFEAAAAPAGWHARWVKASYDHGWVIVFDAQPDSYPDPGTLRVRRQLADW